MLKKWPCVAPCSFWGVEYMERNLDANRMRMRPAALSTSWRQHRTNHQQYGHLPPISKTIQTRQAKHTEHCWRSKGKIICDLPQWTLSHGRIRVARPARTYQQLICTDIGCSLEGLLRSMDDRDEREEIANSMPMTRHDFEYIYIYHHHHAVPPARISLTLSQLFSLLFIASGRSSGLHPVSSHSCCMYVRAVRPTFAWPYWGSIGVHHSRARPRFSSSVLRQCRILTCLKRTNCNWFTH